MRRRHAIATPWQLPGTGFDSAIASSVVVVIFLVLPLFQTHCKAVVAVRIDAGHCGDVDFCGVDAVAIIRVAAGTSLKFEGSNGILHGSDRNNRS